jgi:two-component system nitrate/nitrite sensor histidine kinase NarX
MLKPIPVMLDPRLPDMLPLKKKPDPSSFRSLSMWMIPPASGWKRKRRGHFGNALSRPLAALAIMLLLVGFSGLLIMKQTSDNAMLFRGIGDLARQATYISELSTPPVDAPRLRFILSELSNQVRQLNEELQQPIIVGGLRLPWQQSPAREAVLALSNKWKQDYRPVLHNALDSRGILSSTTIEETAQALVKDIEILSAQMEELSLNGTSYLFMLQIGLLVIGAIITIVILMRVQHQLLEPLDHMRNWASRMRGGNLSARIPMPPHGEFAALAQDVNALANELQGLHREMDNQVRSQDQRLAQKTRSLKILYDVAANLNTSGDLNELLERFLRTLTEVVGAKAGIARLRTKDGQMRLVSSTNLDAGLIEKERTVPVERCLWSDTPTAGELVGRQAIVEQTGFDIDAVLPDADPKLVTVVAVPLHYRDRVLGAYTLIQDRPGLIEREDVRELLVSIGRHLGMAVEKSRLDDQAKRLSIVQERNMLAHELHDSLAQVLASLRFQVRMLEETLNKQGNGQALKELHRIQDGVEEAHAELRQLLVHFRTKMDERGLIPALEDMVAQFSRETQINTFFHNECSNMQLAPEREVQVLHIVQEALTNIRKHSQAHTVRVLLGCEGEDDYRLLLEDDGQGLVADEHEKLPGEQVGLSIMEERTRRLGGTLRIESEPGEGTRVELVCPRYSAPQAPARPAVPA